MTISKANERIGQTILGYSSIHTGNEQHNTHNTASNFQSAIHEENGLYRKVKNSHMVSVNGYTIIDHKFATKGTNTSKELPSNLRKFVKKNEGSIYH